MKKYLSQSIEWGGRPLTLETGKLAVAAQAAITARYGDTVVLATVCVGNVRPELDYFPLTIEYQEKLYAGGVIKGSRWVKREGKPTDASTLNARLIDRSLRPLFPKDFFNETQIVITVLSVDQENDPAVLGLIAASAALMISPVPFVGPLVGVRVGLNSDEKFILNPTNKELLTSPLDLVAACHRDDIVMIETGAKEVLEEKIKEALKFALDNAAPVVDLVEKFREEIKTEKIPAISLSGKNLDPKIEKEIRDYIQDNFLPQLEKPETVHDESWPKNCLSDLEQFFVGKTEKPIFAKLFYDEERKFFRKKILEENKRLDGRKLTEVRPLNMEVGLLPRTHGSAFFQRGQTHVLSAVTLGTPSLEQWFESAEGEEKSSYLHHYNMAPFASGEVGRMTGPGRREIGHGALAERALSPMIPTREKFPYAIRVVSEVMSSSGSTSMGATCASTLALMDAGVPLKEPVSGIAMGLVTDDKKEKSVILTDIAYTEDANGDMDFKIAGSKNGITAIQMDIKLTGIPLATLEKIIDQSHEARMFILEKMMTIMPAPREKVSVYAPKVKMLQIDKDKIKEVIGPGGSVIRLISAETNAKIDVEDDGSVFISAPTEENLEKAVKWIDGLTREIKVGETYEGKVTRFMPFGAFVEFLPGREGLVHVSQMTTGFVERPEDVLQMGQVVQIRVAEIDEMKRVNLSMLFGEDAAQKPQAPRGSTGNSGGMRPERSYDGPPRRSFSPRQFDGQANPQPYSRPSFNQPSRPPYSPSTRPYSQPSRPPLSRQVPQPFRSRLA